jgi:acetyltransferase
VPRGADDREVLWFRMRDRGLVLVRPIRPEDRAALVEGFEHLSEDSRYQRFLAPMARLSARQLTYLTEIDQVGHVAWVAGIRQPDGSDHGVGVARFVREPGDPVSAEFAVVVADDAHGRGIGTLLLEVISVIAESRRVRLLAGLCFAENRTIQHMLSKLGASFAADGPGVIKATVPLPAPVSLGRAARRAVRRAALQSGER